MRAITDHQAIWTQAAADAPAPPDTSWETFGSAPVFPLNAWEHD